MNLVSAIMPTRGRQEWAQQALECFLGQTYANKELVILDDADDPSFHSLPLGVTGVTYERHYRRRTIGAKRNIAVMLARGEIIMHWDSDDWSDSTRMADQVKRLQESGKAVTGYHSILFHEKETDIWGRWVLDPFEAFGTSLCYLKSWWHDHPFNEAVTIGEDNKFVTEANNNSQVISVPGESMIVARAHPGNTSPKDMGNCRPVNPSMIPAGFLP